MAGAGAPLVTRQRMWIRGSEHIVFRGGAGEALVLVHGGWGGADVHWSKVFEPFAATFDVIAPELPGFSESESVGRHSVDDDAEWLAALLDSIDIEKTWIVGNSFGASVAFAFASRFPERCLGLVIVNGFPMPETPPVLKRLGRLRLSRVLMRSMIRHGAFHPNRIAEAFYDPRNVPIRLRSMLSDERIVPLERMVESFILGGSPAGSTSVPTLILWGEDDHLKDSRAPAARELARKLHRARLLLIPRAGHCPQLEQPDAFVEAVCTFAGHV